MQWWIDMWNDAWAWLTSSDAQPVIFASGVLFVAVIVSGLLSAWIARGAIRGLLSRAEREQKAAAVAALVDAAVEASVWNSLTPGEQVLSDRSVGQADILVRLLPLKGAAVAADWAAHQLGELKRNSSTYGYNLEPAIIEFRDRLVEWQNKPRRSRRLFLEDLERWRYESTVERTAPDRNAIDEQDEWVARQHHEMYASDAAEPASTPEPRIASTEATTDASATGSARDRSTADTLVLANREDASDPVGAWSTRKPTGLDQA